MSKIEYVSETVKLPKEANDVRIAIVKLVEDLLAKKNVTVTAAENVEHLMTALNGATKIRDEAKDPEIANVFGLLGADLTKLVRAA